MNRFQLKKEKFSRFREDSDFLDLNSKKDNKSLAKIIEVSEPATTFYKEDLSTTPLNDEFQETSEISPFYTNFLQNMQKFDKIYFFFYKSAT
jgi:hypothetical protein